MKKKIFIGVLLFNFFLLSGCATTNTHVSLSKRNRQSIKTVYIDPDIKKPKEMDMLTTGAQWGKGFGIIGSVIGDGINEGAAVSMTKVAEKNQIDIRKIVYEHWRGQGRSKLKFDKKPTDVVLITDIVMYGIATPHGFTTDYVPTIMLNAKLVRNKEIIWQDSQRTFPLTEGLPRYKWNQIISDPKLLHAMWDKGTEKVIGELLKDMDKEV
jgi:hypothetical protein